MQSGILPSDEASKTFLTGVQAKLTCIKEVMRKQLRDENIGDQMNDTKEGFDKLFKIKKNDTKHRLKTAYSYDIKDDIEFKKSQKIEKRMRQYYARANGQKA